MSNKNIDSCPLGGDSIQLHWMWQYSTLQYTSTSTCTCSVPQTPPSPPCFSSPFPSSHQGKGLTLHYSSTGMSVYILLYNGHKSFYLLLHSILQKLCYTIVDIQTGHSYKLHVHVSYMIQLYVECVHVHGMYSGHRHSL